MPKLILGSSRTRDLAGWIALIGLFSAIIVAAGQSLPPAVIDDRGTFITTLAGKPLGVEDFSIRSGGGRIEAKAVIHLSVMRDGAPVHFETFSDLVLTSSLDPVSYRWNQMTPIESRLQILFAPGTSRVRYDTVGGHHDFRVFALAPDTLILDDNVIHQYELLVMRYDRTAGGKQSFRAFIPQEGVPGMVMVASIGTETLRLGVTRQICRHLAVDTNLTHINLWVAPRERLEKMEIASSQIIIARKQ